jgi:hypothetical protein
VEISDLVRNSVSARVTVSRVTPTTWAISSCVKLKLKRTPFGVSWPWAADSSRKKASFQEFLPRCQSERGPDRGKP